METTTLSVPNISCAHCLNAIKMELEDMEGVRSVSGDENKKSVTVNWDAPASLEAIRSALREINYPADE